MPERVDKSDQQKDAESKVQSFQANLGPFVVATETTRMAMVFTDATERGNPIIFANDSFLALTGYTREEVLGQEFNFMLAHAADLRRWRESKPSLRAHRTSFRKLVIAARTASSSGSHFSSARFEMRGIMWFSISPR
jgi:PAS domain S-box-containing protein